MELLNYFRSGTSHRLRIALNLKGLKYSYRPVDLTTDEQAKAPYKAINPQGLVPALVLDDGSTLIQSPAIIEWLEERYPEPPLLPASPGDRVRVRALAAIVGCDIHPINNRRILQYLRSQFNANEDSVRAWCDSWISAGFDGFEALLQRSDAKGDFCFGTSPTLADVYLIPQVESARRFGVDLGRWPRICRIDENCSQVPAFAQAAPVAQPDAPLR